ncbi:MAG TPA: ABC transporter permease [Candidatus Paceibacterota bacterium]|nr:ABC transporter permease [Candidatus Paceibacterota bacterium]
MKTPFRGFTAILYKEFLVVLRDPMTLFFMFFPPLIEMIAFGYALDTDVKNLSLVVLDEDRTVESRQLVERFVNTGTFKFNGEVLSVEELSRTIRQGKAYVGLQIPPGFTRNLHAGRTARVQVLIDGSNSTIASAALNTSIGVTFRESVVKLLAAYGQREVPVEVRPQILYNPAMRSPNFFVPGVIGVVLQIATTFATAMSLVRERERGTLEQLLVSPLSRWGLMLGKLAPYMVIGMAMATLLFSIMHWLFHVPIAGSLLALTVSTVIYVFALLSLGLLLSTRAQNQMQALQMSMVFIMPSVFFSGFIFPRDTMPWIFQALGACLPTTYFIELMRAIILRGASLMEFWHHLAILSAMGIGLFALCALRFRQKVA